MAWLGRVRQKKPVFVSSIEVAYDASAADGGFHDGDYISQLCLKGAVEVLKTSDGDQTIRIRQLRKHPNLERVLELHSGCHGLRAKPDCKSESTAISIRRINAMSRKKRHKLIGSGLERARRRLAVVGSEGNIRLDREGNGVISGGREN
ncbi:hypothetical protein EV1_007641 [Malus domestica]